MKLRLISTALAASLCGCLPFDTAVEDFCRESGRCAASGADGGRDAGPGRLAWAVNGAPHLLVAFGAVDAGSVAERQLTLVNPGSTPVEFTTNFTMTDSFELSGDCERLEPSETCDLHVSVLTEAPHDAGVKSFGVVVQLPDGGGLTAEGTAVVRDLVPLRLVADGGFGAYMLLNSVPCGSTCEVALPRYSVVQVGRGLTGSCETPGGWSGGGCQGTGPSCVVALTEPTQVEVEIQTHVDLAVTKTGVGRNWATVYDDQGIIDCGPRCDGGYESVRGRVVFQADEDAGAVGVTWGGDCTVSEGNCEIEIDSCDPISVTADVEGYNRTFATSISYAYRNSLTAIDGQCNSVADAGGFPGVWRAFAATNTASIQSRFEVAPGVPARGFVRMDGLPVADELTDLLEGRLHYPAGVPLTGTSGNTVLRVATGVTPTGAASANNCSNWSTFATGTPAVHDTGDGLQTGPGWLSFPPNNLSTCDGSQSPSSLFYCIEARIAAPLTVEVPPAPTAFLSTAPFTPSQGLLAADTICQSEGGPGFKALLPTANGTKPISRFQTTGANWIRADGTPLVRRREDAFSRTFFLTSLDLHFNGSRAAAGTRVLTGAGGMNQNATATCSGWTAGGTTAVQIGFAESASTRAFDGTPTGACNGSYRLYCLKD